jgi:UDP-glucose 4-epimerase
MTDLQKDTVLVTGGGGFIGSHLTEHLVDRGADVVVADDFSRGRLANLDHLLEEVALEPVDLTTREGCVRAVEGVDHVFHLAASVGGIHYITSENVGGLTPSVLMNHHLLEAARREGVDTFLFASSACIYRQQHDGLNEFSEDQAVPADPHSTYGWAKILGEVACEAYHTDCDIETGSVRIFNAYGPRESLDPESSHVIPSLCRKAVETPDGGSIELFGDGTQERGFIYVTDLVEGLVQATEVGLGGEAINLGNAQEVVTINELASRIIDLSGKNIAIEHDRSKPTGTDRYCADTERMQERLNWKPRLPLEEGLRRTYQWVERELTAAGEVAAGREEWVTHD